VLGFVSAELSPGLDEVTVNSPGPTHSVQLRGQPGHIRVTEESSGLMAPARRTTAYDFRSLMLVCALRAGLSQMESGIRR
jgi:hypothetical protein